MDKQIKQKKEEFDNGRAASNILNGLIKTGQIIQRDDGTFIVPGAKK